jgi:hypothetical protein
MRNEQLQGKCSKLGTQQRQHVEMKKTTAYNFIDFIMRDVTRASTQQSTEQSYEENTTTALFANADRQDVHSTVFQLSEEEILREMLSHLAADCPVMMQNKDSLLEKISNQYDTLTHDSVASPSK